MAPGKLRKLQKGWQGVDCQLKVIACGLAISSMLMFQHTSNDDPLSPNGQTIFGDGVEFEVVVTCHQNPKVQWDDLHASRHCPRESKGQ